MTESQPGSTLGELWSGDADAQSNPGADPAQALPAGTDAGRGSRRRSQWAPAPAGDAGSTPDPGPGGQRRAQKKTLWVLGGTVAVVAAVVAVVAALTSGGTPRMVAVASSSSAPRVSAAPAAGQLVPMSRASAASRKAASRKTAGQHPGQQSSSPADAAPTTPSVSSSAPQPAVAPSKASAASKSAAAEAASGPKPVSWWYLTDDTGTTAQDHMGVNPAAGSNIRWCTTGGGNCTLFNGADSQFQTSGPVLDTAPGHSFTVEASVYMTAVPSDAGSETIVSQDGAYESGFYLQYSGTNERWSFSMVTADTDKDPSGIRALSTSMATLDSWTHLVGVYDAPDHQLRLYVNGVLQGTATDSSPFAATGALAIGRGLFGGIPTDWFNGAANQIEVYDVALTAAEVAEYPI